MEDFRMCMGNNWLWIIIAFLLLSNCGGGNVFSDVECSLTNLFNNNYTIWIILGLLWYFSQGNCCRNEF